MTASRRSRAAGHRPGAMRDFIASLELRVAEKERLLH